MDSPPPLPWRAALSAKLKHRLLVAIVALPPLIIFVVACSLAAQWLGKSRMQESAMLKVFQADQGSFERLARMASEDTHLFRINSHTVEMNAKTDPVLPSERVAEYRLLLQRVGAEEGLEVRSETIWVVRSIFGISVSSTTTGWAFPLHPVKPTEENRQHLLASFDQMPERTVDGTYLRPISNGWYLYLESD